MSEDTPKRKRKRTPFEERDKEILCHIIKEVDGGKAWKIIKEGTGTNAQKCVAWEKVKDRFNEATGKSCDRKQIRELFDRIKDKKKRNHDRLSLERSDRNFSRACEVTGGGPSPLVPPEPDGDEDILDFNDLEPTNTEEFNGLTPAADVENMSPNIPRQTGSQIRPSLNGPRFRFPAPSPFRHGVASPVLRTRSPVSTFQIGCETGTDKSLPDVPYVPIYRPSLPVSVAGPSSGHSSAPAAAPESRRVEVQTGEERFSIEVDSEPEVPPPKKPKKGTKKNTNEAASDYYSEMLKIQRHLAALKEKVLKRKERCEILKAKLLMKRLEQEGGTVPKGMGDDDFESEGDEDDSSDDSLNINS